MCQSIYESHVETINHPTTVSTLQWTIVSDKNLPVVFRRILAITYRLVCSNMKVFKWDATSRITHSLDLADLTAVAALCCSPRILLHASRSGGGGRCRIRRGHPRRPDIVNGDSDVNDKSCQRT
jgi:hypothetical protein